jgi:tetratricopeptide (TPR) repeat protein
VYDFNYDGYSRAGVSGKKEIMMRYLQAKAKNDTEISRAEENVIAESRVVPAAMELGVVLIQHAQAETNPQARKSLFDEAEATFLAISRIAGDRDEFQLSLGQVYYWQGRHAEGKTLFDKVLKDHNRNPEWLLQVANLLRDLGSDSEARKLGEEAFNKSAPGELKSKCALLVAILSDDTEERIDWLKKADTNDIHVKATLLEDEATQALEKGNEPQAIANLKQVVSIYESMPESPGSLNNGWIALSRLATLTGDRAARDRADAMIARAAALGPGNSLTLHNASNSSLEASLRDVIGPSIDLGLIRSVASLELVEFLVGDEPQREAYVARLRTHPGVNRTLSMMEKVILLAPQNPSFYQSPARVLLFRKDVEGLRKLLSALNRTQLDLSDQARRARDALSGQKDLTKKRAAQASLAFIEPILPVARAKGGPTFAVAASLVIRARMAAATYGVQTDRNVLVSLAEEAFSRSPSLASRWYLVNALLFRAEDRLARSDSRFAAIRERSFRVVSTTERFGIVLCVEGPLKKRALEDSDVNHALNLLHESYTACPSYTSGPMSWGLLHAKHPEDSSALARLYGQSEWDRIHDEINARINPYDMTNTLKAYWLARMENRENEALKIMKDASSNGFPVPINTP